MSRPDYRYAIEECDVEDKERLKGFRAKRDEWFGWLYGDEHHAIGDQIAAMLWSDAVFRLINESRRVAQEAGGKFATLNQILAQALDRGYLAEQLIAFRKLTEQGARRPEKQVISLRRLLDDIEEHRDLISREIFVCHDGLPFDHMGGHVDPALRPQGGVGAIPNHGPRAFPMSFQMHKTFDDLTSFKGEPKRNEEIGSHVFERMEAALNDAPFDSARRYANKMLLHAADAASRGSEKIDGLNLEDIWNCHRAILGVANRLSTLIGGPNLGGVPIAGFNALEHWSAPFAPTEALKGLRQEWEKENELRESWLLCPP